MRSWRILRRRSVIIALLNSWRLRQPTADIGGGGGAGLLEATGTACSGADAGGGGSAIKAPCTTLLVRKYSATVTPVCAPDGCGLQPHQVHE